jgi:hypothetical protein
VFFSVQEYSVNLGGGEGLNIKSIKITKSMKFLVLLLLSLIVGMANAAIFYSLTVQPAVAITGAKVVFVSGNDFPTGSSLGSNSTWVSLALKAYPNVTLTYEQPVNISNTDTASHNFRLRHVTITPANGQPQVGNYTSISFVVQNTAGVAQGSFNYTTTGLNWNTASTMSYMTLPASASWIIYVETKAVAGANDVTADIQIAVDVV